MRYGGWLEGGWRSPIILIGERRKTNRINRLENGLLP